MPNRKKPNHTNTSKSKRPRDAQGPFQGLIENAKCAIICTSSDGRILSFNREAERIYGVSGKSVIGKDYFSRFLSKPVHARIRSHVKDVLSGNEVSCFEIPVRSSDGKEHWLFWTTSAILDASGRPSGALAVGHDITERKRTEVNYKRIVDIAPGGVWVFDSRYKTTYANKTLANMLGCSAGDIAGKSIFDFMDPAERKQTETQTKKRIKGRSEVYDFSFRRKDGSYLFAAVAATPVIDPKGRFTGAVGVVLDITDRKQTEQALSLSSMRLLDAQRIGHVGNWEWDLVTDEFYWSPETYSLFGLPLETRPSFNVFKSCIHPDDRGFANKAMRDALAGKNEYDIDMRIIRKLDGIERFVNARAETEFDNARKPVRIHGVVMDITDRKTSERLIAEHAEKFELEVAERTADLRAAKEHVEALSVLKDEFLRNISHELKTPLSAILLGLSLVKHNQVSDSLLSVFRRNTDRLALSVDQILQLSKISRVELKQDTVDMSGLVASICDEFLSITTLKAISLDVKADPVVVLGDIDLLRLAVNNLLSNAIKFTDKGSVTVSLKASKGRAHLKVSDTGIGISPEDQKQLFSEFFKANPSAPGTGMGLVMTRQIIEKHDGILMVKSKIGKGSVFEIILPLGGIP